jgi:hypothetical protein
MDAEDSWGTADLAVRRPPGGSMVGASCREFK